MKTLKIIVFSLTTFFAFAQNHGAPKDYHLLVGTYTSGTSEGIYVYKFNIRTGELTAEGKAAVSNPSFLTVSRNQKYVYAVQEESDKAMISAFSFNAMDGTLKFLNSQPSGGASPCHISIDRNGRRIFVGNYTGGSVSALNVLDNGSLDPAVQTVAHMGKSVNKQRQEKPHVHQAVLSPDERYLLTPDLGTDRLVVYPVNVHQANPIRVKDSVSVSVAPGGGPRHVTFHPNGKYVYLVQELVGKVTAYNFDKGELTEFQTVSMLAEKYTGQVSGADIHVSPDGKFLYVSSRGDANEIVIYAISPKDGMLTFVARQPVMGKTPRNFAIDPTGNFLLVANQNSDNIVVFKRDRKSGMLRPAGNEIKVSKPVCLVFTPNR